MLVFDYQRLVSVVEVGRKVKELEENHTTILLASIWKSIIILKKGDDKLLLVDGRCLFVSDGYQAKILSLLHRDH